MEPIKISRIKSNLTTPCTLQNDNNEPVMVQPGETINQLNDFNLSIVGDVSEVDSGNFRCLNVEGDPHANAFAVVDGTGLISALGTQLQDFSPNEPERVKISIPEAAPGHSVSLVLMEDDTENGRVVWVVGDIDDVL